MIKFSSNSKIKFLSLGVLLAVSVFTDVQSEPEKPKVLYHGSPVRGLKVLEPRNICKRSKDEGKMVFASPFIEFSSMFLNRLNDMHSCGVSFSGPHCFICKKSSWNDTGGSIYELPSDSFSYDSNKGRGYLEWTSTESVNALKETVFESAAEAMMSLGVQLFFVDDDEFKEVDEAREELRGGDPCRLRWLWGDRRYARASARARNAWFGSS